MTETAQLPGLTTTGIDGAKVAHIARHVATLPLAKICAQVRAENTREWAKWEKAQDFAQVMQGRYQTKVSETMALFSTDHAQPIGCPLRDYWQERLTTPAPMPPTPAWTGFTLTMPEPVCARTRSSVRPLKDFNEAEQEQIYTRITA